MVIKCFYCESLLNLAENQIPGNHDAHVRCPKCGKEGLIMMTENSRELTLPEDAFNNFRSSGKGGPPNRKMSLGHSRWKVIGFVAVSILVVFFFAALVNVILPGLPPGAIEQPTSVGSSTH